MSISGTSWFAGPNGSGDATYSGAIDEPPSLTSTTISSWVVDTSAPGLERIDDVQIWSGPMDAGGRLLAHPIIQQDRPDVAATLGKSVLGGQRLFRPAELQPMEHGCLSLCVCAQPVEALVVQHVPGVATDWGDQHRAAGRYRIAHPASDRAQLDGLHDERPAYDPSLTSGTGVDRASVYLNGDRKTGVYIGDATLGHFDKSSARAGEQFANAGWQLTFQPSSWIDTQTDKSIMQMTVYAHSSVTGMESNAQTPIVVSLA